MSKDIEVQTVIRMHQEWKHSKEKRNPVDFKKWLDEDVLC